MSAFLQAVAPLVMTLLIAFWTHWTVREVENLRADRRALNTPDRRFPEKQ